MAVDLQWDTDISLGSTGDLNVVSGDDATAQRVRITLCTIQGSYPLDLQFGLPLFTQVLGQAANTAGVRSLIARKVAERPGVASVRAPQFEFDRAARRATFTIHATLSSGETVEISA